jgi:restriction system protein
MAVPPFFDYFLPTLKSYEGKDFVHVKEIRNLVANHFNLNDEDLTERTSGDQAFKHHDRVYWARSYLSHAGLLEQQRRGVYRLSSDGKGFLSTNPTSLTLEKLYEFDQFRLWKEGNDTTTKETPQVQDIEKQTETPRELFERAYSQLRKETKDLLLTQIKASSPQFFERLVVNLLIGMNYGKGDVVGRTGDGGIDGVIHQDPLGLDKIYIQAKRYTEQNVTSSDVRDFIGALGIKGVTKGVFITTTSFPRNIKDQLLALTQTVVLIDGERLTDLMIDYGIGVSTDTSYSIYRIDTDFFEEEE